MENTSENDNIDKFNGNRTLEKYVNELKEDTKLTISTLREKSLMTSSLKCKWLEYYHIEKSNLQRLVKAKTEHAKSKKCVSSGNSTLLQMKSNDKLEENDELFKQINTLTERTKSNIDFIERAMNILDSFGFDIKNVIEIYKLEH